MSNSSSALLLTITAAGQRRDVALVAASAAAGQPLSRARLQALLAAGAVALCGQVVRAAAEKVKSGEVYTVTLPAAVAAVPTPENIPLKIVYEDADVLVLDKPAGLVVHPGAGHSSGTLVHALLAHCGASLSGVGGTLRPGIVHRLDKDTSGLMVVAKHDRAHAGLAAQFSAESQDTDSHGKAATSGQRTRRTLRQKTLQREYMALVAGVPQPRRGTLMGQLGRDQRNRQKMAVLRHGGKLAITHYRVEAVAENGLASLVHCALATGRTHQIRVQLAHAGHAVLGDPLYGTKKKLAGAMTRQALHAARLHFLHPISGEALSFSSPLPADMAELWQTLA